jgi:hypothetical protein
MTQAQARLPGPTVTGTHWQAIAPEAGYHDGMPVSPWQSRLHVSLPERQLESESAVPPRPGVAHWPGPASGAAGLGGPGGASFSVRITVTVAAAAAANWQAAAAPAPGLLVSAARPRVMAAAARTTVTGRGGLRKSWAIRRRLGDKPERLASEPGGSGSSQVQPGPIIMIVTVDSDARTGDAPRSRDATADMAR